MDVLCQWNKILDSEIGTKATLQGSREAEYCFSALLHPDVDAGLADSKLPHVGTLIYLFFSPVKYFFLQFFFFSPFAVSVSYNLLKMPPLLVSLKGTFKFRL